MSTTGDGDPAWLEWGVDCLFYVAEYWTYITNVYNVLFLVSLFLLVLGVLLSCCSWAKTIKNIFSWVYNVRIGPFIILGIALSGIYLWMPEEARGKVESWPVYVRLMEDAMKDFREYWTQNRVENV